MRSMSLAVAVVVASLCLQSCDEKQKEDKASLDACVETLAHLLPPRPQERADRFQGKVEQFRALCRGGQKAVAAMKAPWVDWGNYWGTGDANSQFPGVITSTGPLSPSGRGRTGALLDLETQRVELIRFNLFENSGTYKEYVLGRDKVEGPVLKSWTPFELSKDHPGYKDIRLVNGEQVCQNDLIRGRTLTGICNDVRNPLMGSTGQLFARNVEFDTTFPDAGGNAMVRARHGDRLGLLKPDPQVISRRLLTRVQSKPELCNGGLGLPGNDPSANCEYTKAPWFNVLAAFWIQFMTHDWFSHMTEGVNDTKTFMAVGCSEADAAKFGCRPADRIDRGLVKQDGPPDTFKDSKGREYLTRAPKTMTNHNTAWWDGSQIYGYDETSVKRVRRDPSDKARLLLVAGGSSGEKFLPQLQPGDPMLPDWTGQESTGFPDNYTVGVSFLTNLFAREHNTFVEAFRKQATLTPDADSGLRNPKSPAAKIAYKDVTDVELFDVARLVVAAEIAKIHTIEWTPQLLYDDPLFVGMNGNWNGLAGTERELLKRILRDLVAREQAKSTSKQANEWYSVFASGSGIVGLGTQKKYDPADPDSLNAGVNHFGSAFNFPEEFITVYRLHSLVPDLLELRRHSEPNKIAQKVPVVETFRGKSFGALRDSGMADWGLTFGRQRLGALVLGNVPQFLQNLPIQRLQAQGSGKIDIAALDLIRDREHGIPRFNEFRRQYGLRTLTSFDDFIAPGATGEALAQQQKFVADMRDIYGQHKCNDSLTISTAQKLNGKYVTDCLGKPDGTIVDNIEDLDTVIGWHAEPVRPHGFAISETQFVVFILNASRRLFSDRFLTSGFRKEFYTTMGFEWVNNNGPGPAQMEPTDVNGRKVPVAPMKRLLMRNIPELNDELSHVINSFDPWARDRGTYYSLEWKPRADAADDPAFSNK